MVGITMILIIAAGLGVWWYLRSVESIELPKVFAGETEVSQDQSRRSERIIEENLDVQSVIARYGGGLGDYPRYELFLFRELQPPHTAAFVLRDLQRFIQQQSPSADAGAVLERRLEGIRYGCYRVPAAENTPGTTPHEPYDWCYWQTNQELGILVDRVSLDIRRTLMLTQHARAIVA